VARVAPAALGDFFFIAYPGLTAWAKIVTHLPDQVGGKPGLSDWSGAGEEADEARRGARRLPCPYEGKMRPCGLG